MDQVFLVHLNSAVAQSGFSENVPEDFTCLLPEVLDLDPVGSWYICLKDCSVGFDVTRPVYVCCDICQESIAGDSKLPVLKVIYGKKALPQETCYQVPIKASQVGQIRIYLLRARDLAPPGYSGKGSATYVTLEIRRGLQR